MEVAGMAPVYLSALSHSLGTKVAMARVDDPVLHSRLDTLHDQGLRNCRVTTESPVALAAASALGTLHRSGDQDVGAVVYCTDTRPEVGHTGDLWDFLLQIGRPASHGVVLGGSGCGNLGPGLATARGIVHADGTTVLLVTTDRVAGGTRYLPNGETVLSDGSASCLVGARPVGPSFVLHGLASSVRADVESSPTRMSVARATAHAIAATARRATEPRSPADFGLLVTGNYGRTARSLLAMSAGVPPEQVYCATLADVGHCFSADVLIGLAALIEEDRPELREPVMVLTASPRSWSVAVVERVDGD
jgi:3-oxoacyl-[acyl-carrier-protein] synthase III